MKYLIILGGLLTLNWLLWSGHFDNPFLLGLGAGSCLFSLFIAHRMQIVDDEGAPTHLGIRPFTTYIPWLAREIVVSNLDVAKIVLLGLPLKRNLVEVKASQKTELGKVIFANSITLTPGTVSVDMHEGSILVHAVNLAEADHDLSEEMGRRVCDLEQDDVNDNGKESGLK